MIKEPELSKRRPPATEVEEGLPNGKPVATASGRKMGVIVGRKFVKHIKGSEHLLRRPPAICYDVLPFDATIVRQCDWLLVTDVETGETYTTSIFEFEKHKFVIDRGHGIQYGLELDYWERDIKHSKDDDAKVFCNNCAKFFEGRQSDFLCPECRKDKSVLYVQQKRDITGKPNEKRSKVMKKYWRYRKWYDEIVKQRDLLNWDPALTWPVPQRWQRS